MGRGKSFGCGMSKREYDVATGWRSPPPCYTPPPPSAEMEIEIEGDRERKRALTLILERARERERERGRREPTMKCLNRKRKKVQ